MRMTDQTRRVLVAFLDEDASADRWGYDLMQQTGLQSGTLYPLLARMAARGLVTAGESEPSQPGRPPRKFYRLTEEGIRTARQLRADRPVSRYPQPVRLQIGRLRPYAIGTITGGSTLQETSRELAALLRAVADEIEQTTTDHDEDHRP